MFCANVKIFNALLTNKFMPRLVRGFAFVSTKAVLVKKSRRAFGTHKSKAPSRRELPTQSGEGEMRAKQYGHPLGVSNFDSKHTRSPSVAARQRLAAARSHSRSDMPLACHSLRSCRFATPVPTREIKLPYEKSAFTLVFFIFICGTSTFRQIRAHR